MPPSGATTTSFGELSLLPWNLLGDRRHRAVALVARDPSSAVLARELTAFVVERVAVAVARRIPERRHAAVFVDPPHLHVVRDVAPHQILADAVPRRPFGPQRPDVQALDDRVEDDVAPERRRERDDVRIGILDRLEPRKITSGWNWRRAAVANMARPRFEPPQQFRARCRNGCVRL